MFDHNCKVVPILPAVCLPVIGNSCIPWNTNYWGIVIIVMQASGKITFAWTLYIKVNSNGRMYSIFIWPNKILGSSPLQIPNLCCMTWEETSWPVNKKSQKMLSSIQVAGFLSSTNCSSDEMHSRSFYNLLSELYKDISSHPKWCD